MRIALEGGGARSSFSAGVLDVLAESDVDVSEIIGSSSGSMNAAFFASGQTKRLCELWADPTFSPTLIRWDKFLNPFGGPGIDVDTLCFDYLEKRNELDVDAALGGDIDCYFTLTRVADCTAAAYRPRRENFYAWLQAAMALPVAYNRLVEVDGEKYVDGGVSAPIPFDIETPAGPPKHTLAIITRPIGTNKDAPSMWQRGFIRSIVPKEIRAHVLRQHIHHNACLDRLRASIAAGTVSVISPPTEGFPVSRLTRNPGKLGEAVEIGRRAGKAWLDDYARVRSRTNA